MLKKNHLTFLTMLVQAFIQYIVNTDISNTLMDILKSQPHIF